jgi:hypothetical protein
MKKWFKPKKHSGWKKQQSAVVRRKHLLASTPKNWSLKRRRLSAGRKALALSNVSKDKATKARARADAMYFFRKMK